MMYADSEYYSGFHTEPIIAADEVDEYLKKASSYLDTMLGTNRPDEPYDEKIKDACCEIADCIYICSVRDGISSENNDGYSVTYDRQSINNKAYAIALRYLAGTGLLYRGL